MEIPSKMIQGFLNSVLALSWEHAFFISLYGCLGIWAFLWRFEVLKLRESNHIQRTLHTCMAAPFDQMKVPFAYLYKEEAYANLLFQDAWNIPPSTHLAHFLTDTLHTLFKIETTYKLYDYIAFQPYDLMHLLERQGQTFCLHAKAQGGIIIVWMSPFHESDDDYPYIKKIVDHLPFPIWYRDHHGSIVYCNPAYAHSVDQSTEDVLKHQTELIPAQRKLSPYQQEKRAHEKGHTLLERTHIIMDGGRRLMEIGATPLLQNASMGYAIDVSEVEFLQKSLQRHYTGNREILSNLSIGIAMYSTDARLDFFNAAYAKYFEFNEKWLASRPTIAEVLDDLRARRHIQDYVDFQRYKKECFQDFTTLLSPKEELRHQPNGRVFRMCTIPYQLGGILYTFEDVTEKLGLQTQYNTLAAVQKQTIDNLFESIMVFGSDGRLQIINNACCQLFQLGHDHIFLGKTLTESLRIVCQKCEKNQFFSAGFSPDYIQNKVTHLISARKPHSGDFELKNLILEYAYTPLPDGSHLFSFMDVTDARRLHSTLKEHNKLLEEVDYVKSHFMRHVTQELKSPLNDIHNYAQQQMLDFGHNIDTPNPIKPSNPQHILQSTQNLLDMLDDMFDVSALESHHLTVKPEPIDIKIFMNGIFNMIHRTSKDYDVHIKMDLNHLQNATVMIDYKLLKQALFNVFLSIFPRYRGQNLFLSAQNHPTCINFSISSHPLDKKDMSVAYFEQKPSTEYKRLQQSGATFLQRVVDLHHGIIRCTFMNSHSDTQHDTFTLMCSIPQPLAHDITFDAAEAA